ELQGDLLALRGKVEFGGRGGVTSGDDLNEYMAADLKEVNAGVAVGVGLDLKVAVGLTVADGVEDDTGILKRLVIEGLDDGDGDGRGGRKRLPLAAVLLGGGVDVGDCHRGGQQGRRQRGTGESH